MPPSDILRRRAAAICRAHDIKTEDPIASVANMARTYGVARTSDRRETVRRVIEAVSKSSPFVSPEQMLATLDRSHLAAVPNAPKLPANLSHDEMVRGAEDLLGDTQAKAQRQNEVFGGREDNAGGRNSRTSARDPGQEGGGPGQAA